MITKIHNFQFIWSYLDFRVSFFKRYAKAELEKCSDTWLSLYIQGRLSEKEAPHDPKAYLSSYLSAEKCLLSMKRGYSKKIVQRSSQKNIPLAKLEVNFRITSSIAKYVHRFGGSIDAETVKYLTEVLKRSSSLVAHLIDIGAREADDDDSVLNLCLRDFNAYLYHHAPFYKAKYRLAFTLMKMPITQENIDKTAELLFNSADSKIGDTQFNGLFEMKPNLTLLKVRSHSLAFLRENIRFSKLIACRAWKGYPITATTAFVSTLRNACWSRWTSFAWRTTWARSHNFPSVGEISTRNRIGKGFVLFLDRFPNLSNALFPVRCISAHIKWRKWRKECFIRSVMLWKLNQGIVAASIFKLLRDYSMPITRNNLWSTFSHQNWKKCGTGVIKLESA